jgi:serine/threonine protein kinase
MSYAGEQARKDLVSSLGCDIVEKTTRAFTKLRYQGMEHRDVRPPNILWNTEGRKVMLVDLDCSDILMQMPILQEIYPNRKRKRKHLYLTGEAWSTRKTGTYRWRICTYKDADNSKM